MIAFSTRRVKYKHECILQPRNEVVAKAVGDGPDKERMQRSTLPRQ
jgi:hypothetical protein